MGGSYLAVRAGRPTSYLGMILPEFPFSLFTSYENTDGAGGRTTPVPNGHSTYSTGNIQTDSGWVRAPLLSDRPACWLVRRMVGRGEAYLVIRLVAELRSL